MHNPASLYAAMPEEDRYRRMVMDGRVRDKDWLKRIVESREGEALRERYCDLVLTPGLRLYNGMIEAIHRYLDELSRTKGSDDADHAKLIKRGVDLNKQLKEVEQMIRSEGSVRIKGKYKPRLFEQAETR